MYRILSKLKKASILFYAFALIFLTAAPLVSNIARALDSPIVPAVFTGMKIEANTSETVLLLNPMGGPGATLVSVQATITDISNFATADVASVQLVKTPYGGNSEAIATDTTASGAGPYTYDLVPTSPTAIQEAEFAVAVVASEGATTGHSFKVSIEEDNDIMMGSGPLGQHLAAASVQVLTIGQYPTTIHGTVTADSSPVNGGTIRLINQQIIFNANVAGNGIYSKKVPFGTYNIIYSGKKDYHTPAISPVETNGENTNVTQDIALTANAYKVIGSISASKDISLTDITSISAYPYASMEAQGPNGPPYEGTLGVGNASYSVTVPSTGIYGFVGTMTEGMFILVFGVNNKVEVTTSHTLVSPLTANGAAIVPGNSGPPPQSQAFIPSVGGNTQYYAKVGQTVTLTANQGQSFGDTQGASLLKIIRNDGPNQSAATLTTATWSAGTITFIVPASLTVPSGDIKVIIGQDEMWGGPFVTYATNQGVFTGTVTQPDGTTVVNQSEVELNSKDFKTRFWTQTMSNGTFTVGPVALGQKYQITARPPWGSNPNGYSQSASLELTVTAEGQNIVDGNPNVAEIQPITLSESNINGYVFAPNGTTPIENVNINIHDQQWINRTFSQTNAQGLFRAGGLSDGTYIMELNIPPGIAYSSPAGLAVTISGGAVTAAVKNKSNQNPGTSILVSNNIIITLESPNITGKVQNPDTTPAANVHVQAHTQNWSFNVGAMTDNEGLFRLGGFTVGTVYIIEVHVSPESQFTSPTPAQFTYTTPMSYTDPGSPVLITLASPQVWGVVQDSQAVGVSMTGVGLHTQDWSFNRWSGTDQSGNFSIGGLSAGTYLLEVNPPPNRSDLTPIDPVEVTLTGSPAAVTATDPENVLQQDGSLLITMSAATKYIIGHVYKAGQVPVTNAEVHAWKNGANGWANDQTDQNGAFQLPVSTGNWSIMVQPRMDVPRSEIDWVYSSPPNNITVGEASGNYPNDNGITFTVSSASSTVSGTVYVGTEGTNPPPENSVFINLFSKTTMGGINGPINTDGTFVLNVAPGQYEFGVFSKDYAVPGTFNSIVNIAEGANIIDGDTGQPGTQPIRLQAKNEFITGTVTDSNGQPIENIRVNAFRINGMGHADATTDANGFYSLAVNAGRWGVNPMFDPNSSSSTSNYIYTGKPSEVIIAADETVSNINFVMQTANATITGRLVDTQGNPLTSVRDGFAWCQKQNGGFGGGSPIQNGTFSIKVTAGNYDVGVGFPPGSGYNASPESVTVAAGATTQVDIEVVTANAHIKGHIVDSDGHVVTGVYGGVDANDRNRNWQWAPINPMDGSFDLPLVSGKTWYVHVWVDPKSTGTADGQENNFVFGGGEISFPNLAVGDTTHDIALTTSDSTISGTVTDPNSDPVQFAFVYVTNRTDSSPGTFNTGVPAEFDGTYSVKVPHGTYTVGIGMPPEMQAQGILSPDEAQVSVAAGQTTTKDFQFIAAEGAINGTVTLSGVGTRAFIWAWSEKGRNNFTETDDNGVYSLSVSDVDTWHIGAVKETVINDNRVYYESPTYNVVVGDNQTKTQNIALSTTPHSLIGGVSETFDSSIMKVISLEDGTTISIPAGALASSGDVTVTATPKAEMKKGKNSQPLGLAYDLSAVDENGTSIDEFNSQVTITFPYTEAQLLAAGVTEDDLTAAYFDDSSSLWQSATSFTKDPINNTVSIATTHFSSWTLVGNGSKSPRILSVTSTKANGYFKTGTVIDFRLTYGVNVTVNLASGRPRIALNSGGYANYYSGSGTNRLTFRYIVGAGQNSKDLAHSSVTALSLRGGTIKNTVGVTAINTLPANTAFRAAHNIIIDTGVPTGSVRINKNAKRTRSKYVTLSFSALDATSGLKYLRISNNGSKWSSWITYRRTYSRWNLAKTRYGGSSRKGKKYVYVQYRDKAGNISTSKKDYIKYRR